MSNKLRQFTLVELVLALGILSILAVMAVGILTSVQRLWNDIGTHTGELEKLQNIDRIADYAIKNMVPFHWPNAENKDQEIFRGDPNSILFAYLHRTTNTNGGGIRFLELSLEDKKLVARYRKTPILYWLGEPQDDETIRKEIIAEGIDEIRFEYAEREENDIIWYQDWDEENFTQIPLAVFLYVKFSDGTEEQWLRRTAGSGQKNPSSSSPWGSLGAYFFLSLSSAFFPFIQPDSIFFWTSYSHNSFHLHLFLPWILHRLWNLCGRIFKVHHEVPAGILKNSGS